MNASTDRGNGHTDALVAKESNLLGLCTEEQGKSLLSSALKNTHTHSGLRLSSGYFFCLWVTSNSLQTLLKPKNLKNPHRILCWSEGTCTITALKFLIRNTRIMHSIPLAILSEIDIMKVTSLIFHTSVIFQAMSHENKAKMHFWATSVTSL